jgi:IrrE N-terminal-like domain
MGATPRGSELISAPGEDLVKRTLRLALVLSALGFAGGCVSLTPAQKDTVVDVQGFADATAAAYRMMRIPVTVQAPTNLGIGGVYRQGNLFLNANALDSGHLTALVAHELGHYVLGHEPTSGVSMAELLKAQEVRELDANAKAVEIMMRVKGMPQPQAVRTMVVYLRSVQTAQSRGQPSTPGHRPPSEEIADLLMRFPEPTAPTGPQSAGSSSPSAAAPIIVPAWKPGDQWTFWSDSPRGSTTFVWSVDREEVVDGTAYYVITAGPTRQEPAREFFYQTTDLAWRMLKVNGALQSSAEPPQLRYVWPLTVGGAWEQTVVVTTVRQGTSSTETNARACRVTGEETVTVAGGIYRTIKTVCRDKTTNDVVYEMWYAPEAKHWVKEWTKYPWGVMEREVMRVKVK